MSARDLSGTARGLKLDGMSFRLAADVDISHIVSGWETTGTPTTGATMFKMVKRVRTAEKLDVLANADEIVQLKELAERLDPFTLEFVTAGRDSWSAKGMINMDAAGYADNKVTVTLIPADDWQPTIGQ